MDVLLLALFDHQYLCKYPELLSLQPMSHHPLMNEFIFRWLKTIRKQQKCQVLDEIQSHLVTQSLSGPRGSCPSAQSFSLFVFDGLLPHQVPEQHAEHRVRGQPQEHGAHAFIQPQEALSLAHFEQTVGEAVVQAALRSRSQPGKFPFDLWKSSP